MQGPQGGGGDQPADVRPAQESALAAAGEQGLLFDDDLAPVADVPCATTLYDNPPVADLRRQYGSDPERAGRHVAALA